MLAHGHGHGHGHSRGDHTPTKPPDALSNNHANATTTPASETPTQTPTQTPTPLPQLPALVKWLTTKEPFLLAFLEHFGLHVRRAAAHALGILRSLPPPNPSTGAGSGASSFGPTATPFVVWSVVPGYETVLECFFPLLRSAVWWDSVARRTQGLGSGWVTSLPSYMRVKKTACALLECDLRLLPSYVQTVFECTNANSLLSVDSGVEHLNLFFTVAAVPLPRRPEAEERAAPRGLEKAHRADKTLPATFAYDSFWPPFRTLLESESFQVLLKCCAFLYNNLHLFHGNVRARIVNDLLGGFFFRLFLHWSPEVRACFQHLVVYKVLRADRRFLPCFSDSQVMVLYGVPQNQQSHAQAQRRAVMDRSSPARVAASARAAWGKEDPSSSSSGSGSGSGKGEAAALMGGGTGAANSTASDPPATADEVARLTRSAQRRLALFDRANQVDDEELWMDMAFSSKIDSYVRMCLAFKDADGGGVPREKRAYVEPALEQYALLLIRYYRGVVTASLDDIPDSLSHRMLLSEFSGD